MPAQHDVERAVSLLMQSVAFEQAQRHDEALRCLDEALTLTPNFPSALVKRGTALQALARHQEALADFDRCLIVKPDMTHVRVLRDGALRAALEGFRQKVHADPRDAAAWIGQGNLLLRLQRHDEALACYDQVLAFAPDDAAALFNRGNVLQKNGCYREALASYDAVLAARPGFPEALMEQAHCRLALGELRAGWSLFEARWSTAQLRHATLQSDAPMWAGETLGDGVLLLWAEQGLGDTIQFARYLPLLAQRFAFGSVQIVLRVPISLKSVMAEMAARTPDVCIRVIGNDEALPAHDVHCPLMSLPLACDTDLHTIPAAIPYLHAPEAALHAWQARLGERKPHKLRIGLVWAGGQRLLNNPTRDMPVEFLRPLLEVDAEWISLQQAISATDLQALGGMPPLQLLGDELIDFADTAGLIAQLDMLVSIDSSVAHLAGALGKPVYLMLRKSGEWRWMGGRKDQTALQQNSPGNSPWYPAHRLFRQEKHGEWGSVVQEIARACALLPNE